MQAKQVYTQADRTIPLVSFVIPVYNVPAVMLGECIDSILALTLSDDEREIIVVDDGSSRSPLDELLKHNDKIIYIRQPNQGVSAARNTGIGMARGEYIQFVDGDDRLMPQVYEHCLDIARYKDADMVMFKSATKAGGRRAGEASPAFDGPTNGHEYMRHNNLRAAPWGYIFRRRLLGSLRFHRGIEYGEDEEFTPQLILRAESLYTTDAAAYYYRQHSGSATHRGGNRRKLKRLNDAVDVLCALRDRADVLPYDDRTALQRRIDQLTMDYLYNVIVLTHNSHYLEKCVARLHKKGLFPLPDRNYTRKYKYFRKLVNSKAGRKILLTILPRL